MPVTIKSGLMKYKNPTTGAYVGINAVSDNRTADQIAAIDTAGAAQVSAMEQKGAEVIEEIPSSYTEIVEEVTEVKNALNQSTAATNSDIGKAHSPKTVDQNGHVTEWQYVPVGGGVDVTDVQVNGTSVVNNGVANILLPKTENVTGTTPSITGVADTRYICGECATLDIAVPASGIIDVMFESGSTPTVLTITPPTGVITIQWANGFDITSLEANVTYCLRIVDGEYGIVTKWGGSSPSTSSDYFELIETITLAEDTNAIRRSQTPGGTAYNFKSMILMIDVPAYSKSVDTQFSFNGSYGGIWQLTLWSNTVNTTKRKDFVSIENVGENLYRTFRNSGQQYGYGSASCEMVFNTFPSMQTDEIKSFLFGANNNVNMIPSGTTIYVYGIWA